MPEILAALSNWGLIGLVFAAMIAIHWHLVRTVIPGLVDAFRSEMAEERKACAESLKADREQHDHHMEGLYSRFNKLFDYIREQLAQRPR